MIHREGKREVLSAVVILVAVFAATHHWLDGQTSWQYAINALVFVLAVLIIQFFRNPMRSTSAHSQEVIAPADGKVVVIENVRETEYFNDERLQISIFMSPINVHKNVNPISGIISYFKYHPGKYLVAWHPKSSTENERTTIVIRQNTGTEVLFRQIAGALARRIKYYVKEGQQVQQGAEFGFIKFGSRVDIFLPLGSQVLVQLNQKAIHGKTVIARLPEKS